MLNQAFAVGCEMPQSPASAQCDETLKCGQIADVAEHPDVALDVGGDMGTKPVPGLETAVEGARVGSGDKALFQGFRVPGEACRLAPRQ